MTNEDLMREVFVLMRWARDEVYTLDAALNYLRENLPDGAEEGLRLDFFLGRELLVSLEFTLLRYEAELNIHIAPMRSVGKLNLLGKVICIPLETNDQVSEKVVNKIMNILTNFTR